MTYPSKPTLRLVKMSLVLDCCYEWGLGLALKPYNNSQFLTTFLRQRVLFPFDIHLVQIKALKESENYCCPVLCLNNFEDKKLF